MELLEIQRKINLVTAALASVSYQTNEIVSCLSNIGIEVDELKIDGGMTVNKWFRTFSHNFKQKYNDT